MQAVCRLSMLPSGLQSVQGPMPASSASCMQWQSIVSLTCLLASMSRLTAFCSLTSNMSLSLTACRRCSSERGGYCRKHRALLPMLLAV